MKLTGIFSKILANVSSDFEKTLKKYQGSLDDNLPEIVVKH